MSIGNGHVLLDTINIWVKFCILPETQVDLIVVNEIRKQNNNHVA